MPDNISLLSYMHLKFQEIYHRHFILHAVSSLFQTSRSEAHRWYTSRKLALLDSHPHNLPSSAKMFRMLANGNSEMLAMTLFLPHKPLKIRHFYRCICFPFFIILRLIRRGQFADSEGSTATEKMQPVLSMNFF